MNWIFTEETITRKEGIQGLKVFAQIQYTKKGKNVVFPEALSFPVQLKKTQDRSIVFSIMPKFDHRFFVNLNVLYKL